MPHSVIKEALPLGLSSLCIHFLPPEVVSAELAESYLLANVMGGIKLPIKYLETMELFHYEDHLTRYRIPILR